MHVRDVLDSLAALGNRAAAWDPYGLQLGDPGKEVSRLGVCHEVTDAVLEKSADVDLLITYHPLLFKPVTTLLAGPGPQGRAYQLIRSGVSLAVVHTAWDAAVGGASDALAAIVGLREVEPFGGLEGSPELKLVTFVPPDDLDGVVAALTAAGAGRIGNYTACSFRSEGVGTFFPGTGSSPTTGAKGELNQVAEIRLEMRVGFGGRDRAVAALLKSHPYEEPAFDVYEISSGSAMIGRVGEFAISFSDLVELLTREFGPQIRVAGRDRAVRRAAVIPGSGGSFVREARSLGANVLITGDVSHHQMRGALDLGVAVIDVGHAPSERPGVAALVEAAAKIGPEMVEVDVDPTPWRSR
ncbi:MAG TPA: Nif3-like dinuclear metal center hexameric protein [Acidimicrobiia bacterium]|nr:Nif3-like dinuclear metal center hexameric protein [Acidimicrobiia bacterium]